MQKRRAVMPAATHEDLFIQRYRWLMDWALRLTEQDRQQAEDLVHDAFVQFIISRPSLERIEQNIDGYLYTMLKNMHVSELRRATRTRETVTPLSEFSLTDYDSVESGLRVLQELTNAQMQLQIRGQLRRLCHYACIRKSSSKAGSVLLLRFFHGYYPEEISRVLRTSRPAVEDRLRTARTEARVFLEDPASLSFMSGRLSSPPPQTIIANTAEDFIQELRRDIYFSREGTCLSRKEIEHLYAKSESIPIDQQTLGHFVSCTDCLDTVNRVLDLPLLADRFPINTMSKDTRKQDKDGDDGPLSGAGSSGGSDDLLTKVRRKAKDVLSQRPVELRISVNGFILGSQSITSHVNRQTISVKGEERIGFVEIFSEKEVRLLFSCVEPPPNGPTKHKERVALSDGRSLELLLDFSSSAPDLHVSYTDPILFLEPAVKTFDLEDALLPSDNFDSQGGLTKSGLCKSSLKKVSALLTDWRLYLRPGTVTALLALVLISGVLFLYWSNPAPRMTAEDLLQKSAAAEEAARSSREHVVHRIVQLEEKSSTGQLLARRRIEIWQSADKGITARRLYDEGGGLIAGDWRRQDGAQTIYHHGMKPRLQMTLERRKTETGSLDLERVWQFEPSAKDFRALIATADKVAVADRGLVYILNYESPNELTGIVRASLTLNKPDLRATELTIVIRSAENGIPQLREFQLTERAIERRVPGAVALGVFEPDPELLSSEPVTKNAKPETTAPAVDPPRPTPAIATPELELQAAYLLDQIKANLGEQISLNRTRGGLLRVEGIVETPERKAEIMRALAHLSGNPAVVLDVRTVREASQRQSQESQAASSSVTLDRVQIAKGTIPLDSDLRRYFAAHVAADMLDEEVRQFGNRMIGHARKAQMHGRVLKSLFERFTPEELRLLDSDARTKRMTMIRQHAEAFRQETARLRQALEAVFFAAKPPEQTDDEAAIRDEPDFRHAIERLFELGAGHENAMYASFSISSEGATTSVAKTPQLWQSLRRAEKLAARIASSKQ
ncbi:MAG TPA: RNA polymerase sigma factor [Pyrinomonadaceae bacterium]|nr:RNA polymerase sigma factor [Pyrinomonadaceae bacterium]